MSMEQLSRSNRDAVIHLGGLKRIIELKRARQDADSENINFLIEVYVSSDVWTEAVADLSD